MIITICLLLMTRRGSDEYHPKLFLGGTINDGSSIGENVFRQIEAVTAQKVADIDYELQIERWNQYQELLDKIEKKCGRQAGVRLSRNVKHNVKTFDETTVGALGFIALIALMSILGSHTINSTYGMIASAIALSYVGWQSFIRVHHPSVINFRCCPVLHIDEFAYMRQAIKGIPPVEHDPTVRLPVLEMAISRTWLGQQGMLKFMESLSDLKLKEDGKKNDGTNRMNP